MRLQHKYKPVGWQYDNYRHYLASKGIASKMRGTSYLAAKYGSARVGGRKYNVEKSDFVRYGGETYFRSDDGKLINIMNARDIQEQDDAAYEEARIMGSIGVFPWESAPIVESVFTSPLPVYSAKKMPFYSARKVGEVRKKDDGLVKVSSSGDNTR